MVRTLLFFLFSAGVAVMTASATPSSRSDLQSSLSGSDGHSSLAGGLSADVRDGTLDQFTLLEAALILSGTNSDPELVELTKQFEFKCRDIVRQVDQLQDRREKLNLLLVHLHTRMLTGGYRPDCADVRQTVQSGRFNCVTATIVFQVLAEQCGLSVRPIAGKSHVLISTHSHVGSPLFLETTARQWRASTLEECDPRIREVIADGRVLTTVQLLSKLIYNQGVKSLESKQFAQAVERFEEARRLDPQDESTQENLLAAYNNWALVECDFGAFEHAAQLVRQGLAVDDRYGPLLANDLHIHQKWTKRLCEQKEFARAIRVLEECHQRRPSVEFFARGRSAVLELWAREQFLQADLQGGWNVLTGAQDPVDPQVRVAREIAVIEATHAELIERGNLTLASEIREQALQRHPNCAVLRALVP